MNSDDSIWHYTFHFHVKKKRQIYCLGKSHCETKKEKRSGICEGVSIFHMK